LAVCRSGSFHDRLADSRVRMNTGYDFVAGSFEFTGGDGFGDDFGHVVSDHMATEPFAVLGVKNDFDKTLRRTSSFCFSRGSEWKLTYFNLKSGFPGLFLCVAYRSYFWDAVSTRWDVVVIHRGRGLSGNFFNADNTLRAGHVRQSRTRNHVTNGVDPLDLRLIKFIDGNQSVFGFDPDGFQSYIFSIG